MSDRPTFTLAGAARAVGKSERTLSRRLRENRIPGAVRLEDGAWSIPLEGLLEAGFELYASQGEAEPPVPAVPLSSERVSELEAELLEVRRQLAAAEGRAVTAEREAASQGRAVETVERALAAMERTLELANRQLESGSSVAAVPAVEREASGAGAPRRRWLGRFRT